MAELLAALQRRSRRGVLTGAALLAVAGVLGAMLWHEDRGACEDALDLSDLASPSGGGELRESFSSTALPFASTTADKVIASLADYTQGLMRAREQVCGDPLSSDPALRSVRLSCLDRRALALRSLRAELQQADASVVENAVDAVSSLPKLERCLTLTVEDEPQGPHDAALRLLIARAEAAESAGRARAAADLAQDVVDRAKAAHDAATTADGLMLRSKASFQLGEQEAGISDLEQALALATVSGLDERTTATWVELAIRGGRDLRDTQRAPGWLKQAEAWVQRTELDALASKLELARGHVRAVSDPKGAFAIFDELLGSYSLDDEVRVEALDGRAATSFEMGDYSRAIGDYQALLDLRRQRYGDEHPKTAAAIYNLGIAHDRAGRPDALERYQQALELWTKLHPSGHPDVAKAMIALATAELARGHLEPARSHARAALELQRRLAPEDVALAEAWTLQGAVQHASGELDAALRSHEEAMRIYAAKLGGSHYYSAIARSNAGEALMLTGQRERAEQYFLEAVTVLESTLAADHPALAYPLKGRGIIALIDGRTADALTVLQRARTLAGPHEAVERDEIDLALSHALTASGDEAGGKALLDALDDRLRSASVFERARIQRLRNLLDDPRLGVGAPRPATGSAAGARLAAGRGAR